ncbi:MAG: FHA domain-containing protein, partial [Chloroflexi bacterium]
MRDHEFSGPKLVVRHTGQRFSLAEAPVTIGRDDDNRIVLADGRASRHHATIEDRAGTLVVQDLQSANGTFVNGRRVAGTQVLRQDDAIRIGDTFLDVHLGPGRDPAATIQAARPAPPGVYTAGQFGAQTQHGAGMAADWQASRRGSPWPVALAGLLVVGIIVAAVLAFLLLRRDGAAPVTVVLESPANGSQVTTGSQVPLEATATGLEITSLELLVDGILAATASSPEPGGTDSLSVSTPWVFQAGTHIISARARTAGGEVTEPVAASLLVVDAVGQASPSAPPGPTEEPGPAANPAAGTPEAPTTEPPSPEPAAVEATGTPTNTPAPPTNTPESGGQPPPAGPGLITGFEEFGTWRR